MLIGSSEEGELYSWGFGMNGRLGHGDDAEQLVPKKIEFFEKIKQKVVRAFAGGGHNFAITGRPIRSTCPSNHSSVFWGVSSC
jgi:alpha-tubulin suppressor-like RCC1 family protein